jgi:hypothetical protein
MLLILRTYCHVRKVKIILLSRENETFVVHLLPIKILLPLALRLS